ncbi:iron complex transport system substrate-binding protein [Williamsia limnetica]|uniref:Iron complex transport system substrate-binding protein n=1 Tax=Williamsia limnetica TaxID=882452 RepID=A0A318RQF3_WILLI|nr:ABC transporter substrate-binding protein [Williamsia limnetica]PYE20163.1 iron complex transport system substrate-binding protein [Williamsia limnetica]
MTTRSDPHERVRARRRRPHQIVAAALTALAVVAVAACGTDANEEAGGSAQFTYTDSRGAVVELDQVPTRIVASEQAAAALIPLGVTPVGVWGGSSFADSIPLEGLDLSGIESVGQAYGEINLEAVAALEPDLIVTGAYAGDALGGIGSSDSDIATRLGEVAPIVTVSAQQPSSKILDTYQNLARDLGADPNEGAIAQERAAYDAAVENLKAAIAAKPDLTAMAISPSDQFYIAINEEFPELLDYQEWGLTLISSPVARTENSGSFSPVSWESVGDYQPDLILLDTRSYSTPLATLERERPTWQFLEAARAGHVADWTTDATNNYTSYTAQITALTEAIQSIDTAS